MHKSQVKVVICSILHVPTRRWTTFVVFRQRNASPGRTSYLRVLPDFLFVSLEATKNEPKVASIQHKMRLSG